MEWFGGPLLAVLRITDSDYPFGIFKLFLEIAQYGFKFIVIIEYNLVKYSAQAKYSGLYFDHAFYCFWVCIRLTKNIRLNWWHFI